MLLLRYICLLLPAGFYAAAQTQVKFGKFA